MSSRATVLPDIFLDLPIKAPAERVFRAVSKPEGLDTWWTKRSAGTPRQGSVYELGFGPKYDWRATVSRCIPAKEFELEITAAAPDWIGTRVGFRLEAGDGVTWLRFRHSGWPSLNEHYRISCNCWAMYLRVMRRSLTARKALVASEIKAVESGLSWMPGSQDGSRIANIAHRPRAGVL